ncbi:DNA mismatch repair protein MutS [Microlunatus elymi]|uniref:DNA mismatch repair protein MutS n=1 Tax=Microlunatus elymi TaxID=2596828 RepID=A0A516PXW6_9ACTN|nr:DNA mismatch repair protein MutS [Microlunatus elymi]QDP95992.1 DNA mismatch repair protein MutS [Microlunatus elymi]
MKVQLMFADRSFPITPYPSLLADDLVQDLQLETIFEAMSGDDRFLYNVVRSALLAPLRSVAEIRHRQQVLNDCIRRPNAIADIYTLAGQAVAAERKIYVGFVRYHPSLVLHRAINVLSALLPFLDRLHNIAATEVDSVTSPGLSALHRGILADLDDEFFAAARQQLRLLQFPDGVIIGKHLGQANTGVDDLLHPSEKEPLLERVGLSHGSSVSVQIPARDDAGAQALEDLRDRAVNHVADAAGQAADFLVDYFRALRRETGFYLGCLNLRRRLADRGRSVVMPEVAEHDRRRWHGHGLYEPCLALSDHPAQVVPNDLDADSANGVIITGANSGGKSTFLRTLGTAQLMAQCGMFVAADDFCCSVRTDVCSHFIREEDSTMSSGRFDDELIRLGKIVDAIGPGALILMNESLASTDAREAADLGTEFLQAFADRDVGFVFVTHNYDLARRLRAELPDTIALRAQRRDDGARTYRVLPGEPLPTSFGKDIYQRVMEGSLR